VQAQRRNASTVLHNAYLTAYFSLLLITDEVRLNAYLFAYAAELLNAYSAVQLGMTPTRTPRCGSTRTAR